MHNDRLSENVLNWDCKRIKVIIDLFEQSNIFLLFMRKEDFSACNLFK